MQTAFPVSRSRKPTIRLVNLGHCLLYGRERVALYYFETSPEGTWAARQWRRRNRIPFEWSENRDGRYDNASFRESGVPFPLHTAKVTRFYPPPHKDLKTRSRDFHFFPIPFWKIFPVKSIETQQILDLIFGKLRLKNDASFLFLIIKL